MCAMCDELLAGRTKGRKMGDFSGGLTRAGIDLKECRSVADEEDAIVEALNALRARYDYVFTSGGIGPTHDDITADAVSRAFGLPCTHDAEAMRLLAAMYVRREMEFTEARQRMARMPQGAAHIANPVSTAPGFTIGNVHVMAGVPQVFQAMLDNVLPQLRTGSQMLSRALACPYGEGEIGTPLAAIQKAHPTTNIGSYPKYDGRHLSHDLVVRARDEDGKKAAEKAVLGFVLDNGEAAG